MFINRTQNGMTFTGLRYDMVFNPVARWLQEVFKSAAVTKNWIRVVDGKQNYYLRDVSAVRNFLKWWNVPYSPGIDLVSWDVGDRDGYRRYLSHCNPTTGDIVSIIHHYDHKAGDKLIIHWN